MTAPAQMNILVASSIAASPNHGGWTWAVLQYLLGLKKLGHDVHYLEVIDPALIEQHGDWSPASVYFRAVMADFDFRRHSTMLLKGRTEAVGASYEDVENLCRRSDLLINLSGVLTDDTLLRRCRRRLYVDLDPGFTQLWHDVQKIDMGFARHTHHATIGLGIGQPSCDVPTCGVNWITTPQPIVLDHWPFTDEPIEYDGLTTIANWRGYGSIEHNGVFYGQKAHALRPIIELPAKTREKFILAMSMHENEAKDLELLKSNGWRLIDPELVAASPQKFQRFVQTSKAEFGLAKSGYVHANCGWFSDRSVCYLASGRPVVMMDTGIGRFIPVGKGLLTFSTIDEAVTAIDSLSADYAEHRAAARGLAETYFDSDKVLTKLLDQVA